jgi:hypothetical protein
LGLPIFAIINERNPGPAHNLPIWQVARATTAAPLYFSPVKIGNRRFGDGAFGTNNPAIETYWEVRKMHGGSKNTIKLLLSIGTGGYNIDRIAEGRWKKYSTFFKAMKKLAADTASTHEMMMDYKNNWGVPYHRFNVPTKYGLGEMKLDAYKAENLDRIEKITEEYCKKIDAELLTVAKILVEQRQRKSHSSMWPLVSTGNQYRCTVENCHRSQELLPRESDLEIHIDVQHSKLKRDEVKKYVKNGSVKL